MRLPLRWYWKIYPLNAVVTRVWMAWMWLTGRPWREGRGDISGPPDWLHRRERQRKREGRNR
jgi:hypothetical protein